MGIDPLPFDTRGGCFCHQNCPDWRRPEKRYWLVIPGATPPQQRLAAGVVVDWFFADFVNYLCRWAWEEALPPFIEVLVEMKALPPIPGGFRSIEITVWSQGLVVWHWLGQQGGNFACGFQHTTFFAPDIDTQGWGPGDLYRIPWYANADDVPH